MSEEAELSKVLGQISFGLLSPSEIRKLSVVEIKTADTYDEDGAPITSGLMDGRLGTLEPRQRCKTCGNTAARCPGHFGNIELAVPVIHVEFAKIIYKLLTTVCRSCGHVLLSTENINQYREKMKNEEQSLGSISKTMYKKIEKNAKKNTICPHCGAKQLKIKFSKPTTFHEILEDGGVRKLNASIIRERLERIPDNELDILGFNSNVARPDWMILHTLPVPPVYVRPSITLESGIRSEDDLTHKLVDIIRINQRLKENIDAGAPTLIIQDLSELLQYHVTTYFNNEASGIPPARHRSGRPLKTISQRLKGKEGRFRSNLSGKRVDFSARTVISPDPNIGINEVGVPYAVAKQLTIPVKVTLFNIDEMKRLIINGPDKYPGAIYVVRPDGKRLRLEFVTEREKIAEAIQPGFTVERHLRNGDIVIFNRQPSLHRMSIMAHHVKVLPYKTFRLNLCVCVPYNADFDGDEMNLHVPQSTEARTEAHMLMRVQDQILSPRYGGPIIGAIRDHISAAFLLTSDFTKFGKEEVYHLLTAVGYDGPMPKPKIKGKKPLWTGKQIFSLFLPEGFNYTLKSSICRHCSVCLQEKCENDAFVVVRNGELKKGVIDKNSIGAERSESMFHRIVKDYGTEAGKTFLNSMSRLLTEFISILGFTFSIDELDLSDRAKKKIRSVLERAEKEVQELIQKYRNKSLKRLAGKTLEESLEIYIMNKLAQARDEAGKVADRFFTIENHGIIMTKTGARGSNLNIGQMAACLGQQSVRGKRITLGYKGRTLSHFKIDDPSPEARGFVNASYRTGLNPTEFFFHAMGGREGLVDTAVRTQQSGYMQRRLINALEQLRVEYDETVRNSVGDIISFKHGDDGVDPAKSDHGKAVNIERLVETIKLTTRDGKPVSKNYIEKQVNELDAELSPALQNELKKQLLKVKLGRKGVNKAIFATVKNFKRTLVEPGEAVGIVAAQSIGEPGTQMTLRTFHYAGVKEMNVTLGLPRLIEIVDARRSPSTPIMTIPLDKEHKVSKEKATEIAHKILSTTIEDVAKKVYIDSEQAAIVIVLDKDTMKAYDITLEKLHALLSFPNCNVKVDGETILVTSKKTDQDLRKLLAKTSSVHVRGVPDIRKVLITEEGNEWRLNTDGSNLSKTLAISGIDPTRTVTNNIHEIAKSLGIEAARNSIIREAFNVLGEQGLDVDLRHIMLVADIMTHTGEIRQIGRHGVSGQKSSILARAAFEITLPTIVEAATKGSSDRLNGVTESVIVGQNIPIGTGLIELYMGGTKKS